MQQALYRCHCAVRVPSQMQMRLCHSHAPRYSTAATLAERVKALTASAEALPGKQRQDLLQSLVRHWSSKRVNALDSLSSA